MKLLNNPIFLQAASNVGEAFAGIKMTFNIDDPEIDSITGTGNIVVTSVKDGQTVTETYTNLEKSTVSIEADADTEIVIIGNVTELNIRDSNLLALSATNTALTSLDCRICYALRSLDLSTNTALTSLDCYDCRALRSLDLSKNTALTSLNCSYCHVLQSLDLSKNTALTSLDCVGLPVIITAKFRAIAQTPSTKIAKAITDATSTTGTVYLNSADPYYSTVADAATAKGWTVAEL